jgi:hypothetical protein
MTNKIEITVNGKLSIDDTIPVLKFNNSYSTSIPIIKYLGPPEEVLFFEKLELVAKSSKEGAELVENILNNIILQEIKEN